MPSALAHFDPAVRRFLARPDLFAVVATVDPDGSAHQAVVWFRMDDDSIVINSADGRRWPANLRRDPRASVMVADAYHWVSLRGEVEIVDDQGVAQADIAEMAHRYHAGQPDVAEREIARFRTQRRVSFVLRRASIHADLEE